MSTLKSVGNKLFKTELANHNVELGVAQDLEKEISNIKSLSNPISQNIDKLTNLDKLIKDEKQIANQNLDKLNSSYSKAVSIYDKLEKASKELGIDSPILKTAFSELKGAEEDFNELKKLLNLLK